MKRENKGITLVSLVITIIILLILAGIVITLTIRENGLIAKAKEAGENYMIAQSQEDEYMKQTENWMDSHVTGSRENSSGQENYLEEEMLIGKWVDGKDLYRRVYVKTDANAIDISDLNYDYIQVSSRIHFLYTPHNKYYWRETYYFGDINDSFIDLVKETEKKIHYVVGSNMIVQKIVSIVEYTKK